MKSKFLIVVLLIGCIGSIISVFYSNTFSEKLGWLCSFMYASSCLMSQVEIKRLEKELKTYTDHE